MADIRADVDGASDGSDSPLEQQAALGGGASFWTTKAAPGVAAVTMSDGPHGVRFQSAAGDHLGFGASDPATCFPPAVGLAQSWDPDLARRIGAALADEAQAAGLGVLLGPGVNIKRDPRCGRNFEYFSEDPHLSGVLATAWVRGLQSGGVGASLKHFAVNNQEHDRMRTSADVDARTLREIYLRAFERVVRDAQPWTVMCSYNRINGVYASQNRWLLTDVLRKAWGFEGLVVSDWGAVADRVAAVAAGVDLQMPGDTGADDAAVVAAATEGRLDVSAIERAAHAVARLSAQVDAGAREVDVDYDVHHALAREAAGRSVVLLKNDAHALPLDVHQSVAVIGAFATRPRYQGGGSSHVTPTRVDSPLDELRAVVAADVTFAEGFTVDGTGDQAALRAGAVRTAREAHATVVFVGLPVAEESEGFDRDHIELPTDQLLLVDEVCAAQPNSVVVVSAGGVLHLSPIHAAARAILGGALLGQAAGGGIADVLVGAVNPSGRLAETVPLRLQDAPSFPYFPGEHSRVRYGEGLFVGYRGYDVRDHDVLFPFGHGLSYTTFDYADMVAVADADGVVVDVTVCNTGMRSGREVVQVYASLADSTVSRAPRELVGFGSVDLEPGASAVVSMRVERRDLAFWHDRLDRWVVETGTYRFAAGASSRDLRLEREVEVHGDPVRREFDLESTIGELLSDPIGAQVLGEVLPFAGAERDGSDLLPLVASIPIGRAVRSFGDAIVSTSDVAALLDSINTRRNAGG